MKYLVIGATGTMGKLVVNELGKSSRNVVVCMSRDEQKIAAMPKRSNVRYMIGDIRDKDRVVSIVREGFDSIINLSALKCVDIVEANPIEAVKTNVIGSQNLIEAAEASGFPKLIFTSSDKAVYPINAYGQSKAMAECLYRQYRGPCTVFRYGNILGSRGSVLHTFVNQLIKKQPITITGLYMTRFWIKSDDICRILVNEMDNLVLENKLKIVFSKALKIYDVAVAVTEALGLKHNPRKVEIVGFRPGEKLHETLVGSFEKYEAINFSKPREKDYTSQNVDQYQKYEFMEMIEPIVAEILGEK